MSPISATGECPKSVKLLIMRLSVSELGCLMALKCSVRRYVSVNSPSYPTTEAPLGEFINTMKRGSLIHITSCTTWSTEFYLSVMDHFYHWSVFDWFINVIWYHWYQCFVILFNSRLTGVLHCMCLYIQLDVK